jgi:hypothetical protein
VCDITFFRLTDDRTWLARLDQFIDWRVGWLARARRVEQLVGPGAFDDRRDSSRPNLLNNA